MRHPSPVDVLLNEEDEAFNGKNRKFPTFFNTKPKTVFFLLNFFIVSAIQIKLKLFEEFLRRQRSRIQVMDRI